MDETTLNDLLECSVCLERLDTSSKVLPCQHTFCRKCLEEIVERHKELRCPECRILVPLKIEELPPNVLLMRILEGMRNSTPKALRSIKTSNTMPVPQQTTPVHQSHHVQELRTVSNKQHSPAHHVQPYAKAIYDYISNKQGDLNFKRGDIILLKKRIDNHWYQGECAGNQGVFPLCYVQVITPVPSHTPQCKALYDFRMTNDEEEGCLSFNKGDIISVIRRVDENWAEGKLNGRIGIFPLAFVELNSLARSLMKLSTNSQPGPSKVAPPTPTADDSAPLIPTDHTKNMTNITLTQQIVLPASDSSSTVSSSSSSTTTPNVSSSSSTAPSSPASPPPRNQSALQRALIQKPETHQNSPSQPPPNNLPPPRTDSRPAPHQNREKRHSFTSLPLPNHNPTSHRHSAEIPAPDSDAQAHQSQRRSDPPGDGLPAAYVALYPYKPQKPDELELRKGGIYFVTERCLDGWFKGTSNRTQKCGVFPGNYVTQARGSQPRNGGEKSTVKVKGSQKVAAVNATSVPPELPPRAHSPNIFALQQLESDNAAARVAAAANKLKSAKEKTSVSLMKRLTSMKRAKSPPPSSYSMDNPVFEDASLSVTAAHPVHVRSGSCPSQLLESQPIENHRIFTSASQRLKHKERPRIGDNPAAGSSLSSPEVHSHRKSNSLDAGRKTGTQNVRERFRCIAPYPPNSEYELELQVNDIIYVHKKRDDGWYKGTQQRTGRTGLFPASFVEGF